MTCTCGCPEESHEIERDSYKQIWSCMDCPCLNYSEPTSLNPAK